MRKRVRFFQPNNGPYIIRLLKPYTFMVSTETNMPDKINPVKLQNAYLDTKLNWFYLFVVYNGPNIRLDKLTILSLTLSPVSKISCCWLGL